MPGPMRGLMVACLLMLSSAAAAAAGEAPLALVGGTLWDGTGRAAQPDTVLILRGGRIATVGPVRQTPLPADALALDVRGKWIIPGLIDAHVHFYQSGSLYTRPDMVDLRRIRPYAQEIAATRAALPRTLARYLASGVTSVVDLAGPAWTLAVRDLARAMDAARLPTPRVAAAGPGLAPQLPAALRTEHAPGVVVRTPQQARAAVQQLAAARPDLLKLWFVPLPGMDLDQEFAWVRAAVAASHALGRRVVTHATERETARRMLDAGVDILAHSVFDQPLDAGLLQRLRRQQVIYITTLGVAEGYREVAQRAVHFSPFERRLGDPFAIASLADLQRRFPRARPAPAEEDSGVAAANLRRVQAAGVVVAAGSDAGNIATLHGPALHHELELMVAAGLTPDAALRAATHGGAQVLGRGHELGTLEPGKLADLLVLDADPLTDIRNTQRIAWVVKGGRVHSPVAIRQWLQQHLQ